MSNFSISHSVFKWLVSQGRQKVSLCGNGLTDDKIFRLAQIESICRRQIKCYLKTLTLSSIYTHFNTLKKKAKMSNFTFFHSVFYAIFIFKFLNSHISVVVCNFFEFGMVSKRCIREWVKVVFHRIENIVGKEENASYQHFLLFAQCFQKVFFPPVRQKSSLCGNGIIKFEIVVCKLFQLE